MTTEPTEGAVVTFPSFDRKNLRACRRIGIVRWVTDRGDGGTVTIYSPENGRTYCLAVTEDIRIIPSIIQ